MRHRVVYPDAEPGALAALGARGRARIAEIGELAIHHGRARDVSEYARRIEDATIVLLGWELPAQAMRAAPRLELVCFTGIGVGDHVDLPAAAAQGITVCNTPGYADRAVAEHALALLLAAARQLPVQDRALRSGRWSPRPGVELAGKRLGVLGFGGIGRRMAVLGLAIGMDVVGWTRNPRHHPAPEVPLLPLTEVLESSDALSIHVALGADTAGLIDASALARMRRGAILVNTARGGVVDEAALLAALESGHLAAAGLDVFATEPLPADHPLLAVDNVVLTPHVAYKTPQASAAIFRIAVDNIVAYATGQPRNVVVAPGRDVR